MRSLQPVDFKAVAAKGAFVYCYLRADGSPYYVGIADAGRWNRPFQKHTVGVPKQFPERVRVMRSGLTYEQAKAWEVRYIAHYGRKDMGTGILRNATDGGDGNVNPSAEVREKIAKARRGVSVAASTKAKLREANLGKTYSKESKAKRSASLKVALQSDEARAIKAESGRQGWVNNREAMVDNIKAAWAKPGAAAKRGASISAGKAARKAAEFGFTIEEWMGFTKTQREKAGETLPKATALGYTLTEWWALPRGTKMTLLAQLRAA